MCVSGCGEDEPATEPAARRPHLHGARAAVCHRAPQGLLRTR